MSILDECDADVHVGRVCGEWYGSAEAKSKSDKIKIEVRKCKTPQEVLTKLETYLDAQLKARLLRIQ